MWGKGLVERFHDYLERSWLPGRAFASPADFNAQLAAWVATVNTRWRRHLECAPADRIGADRAAMTGLPPVAPVTGWHKTARLPRDHYIRLDANDYSVDPAVIGRRIEITADLARVKVTCDGRVVADHQRCWARHQTITDPAHLAAAQQLRSARRLLAPLPGPADARGRGGAAGPGRLRRAVRHRGRSRVMSEDSAVLLAARMRAAADLVEACGAAGLHASCYSTGEISVGVTSGAGDGPARAKILAGLALLLQARPGRSDSRTSPAAWLTADGQAGGVPVHAWTELAVATTTGPGGAPAPLARSADGHLAILPDGQLPPGWRWVTELDDRHLVPAGQQVVA